MLRSEHGEKTFERLMAQLLVFPPAPHAERIDRTPPQLSRYSYQTLSLHPTTLSLRSAHIEYSQLTLSSHRLLSAYTQLTS